MHLLPGDPAQLMAGSDAPQATIDFVRHDMGLDQPLPVQYVVWLGHILRGDFGKSIFSKLPVSQLIGQRAPATIELAIVAAPDKPNPNPPSMRPVPIHHRGVVACKSACIETPR